MEAVTVYACACRLAAMAPTRSMNCIRRPPKRLPIAFESLGKIISLRSDWDSQTGRGATPSLILFAIPPLRFRDNAHIPLEPSGSLYILNVRVRARWERI